MAQSMIDYVNKEYSENQKRFQEKVQPFTDFLKAGYEAKLRMEEEQKIKQQGLRDLEYTAKTYGEEFTPSEEVSPNVQKERIKLNYTQKKAEAERIRKLKEDATNLGIDVTDLNEKQITRAIAKKKSIPKPKKESTADQAIIAKAKKYNIDTTDKNLGEISVEIEGVKAKQKETEKLLEAKQKELDEVDSEKRVEKLTGLKMGKNFQSVDIGKIVPPERKKDIDGIKRHNDFLEGNAVWVQKEQSDNAKKDRFYINVNGKTYRTTSMERANRLLQYFKSLPKDKQQLQSEIEKLKGGSVKEEKTYNEETENKIKTFMEVNGITDRNEAINILKENKVL